MIMGKLTMVSQPVPVLLMTRSLGPGGSERQMTEAAKAFDRRLFCPHVACVEASGFRFDELREHGVPVLTLPMHSFLGRDAWHAAGAYLIAPFKNPEEVLHLLDETA